MGEQNNIPQNIVGLFRSGETVVVKIQKITVGDGCGRVSLVNTCASNTTRKTDRSIPVVSSRSSGWGKKIGFFPTPIIPPL
jgi:hypothetical protein